MSRRLSTLLILAVISLVVGCQAPTPEVVEVPVVETVIVKEEVEVPVEVEVEVEKMVTPTPEALPPVTITFWSYGAENQVRPLIGKTWEQLWGEAIDAFNEDYPDITIEHKMVGYVAGGTTLHTDAALAGGDPPDLMHDWSARLVKYAGQGLLLDLSDVVAGLEDDFTPGLLPQTTSGQTGELWAVPHGSNVFFMMINKTLFEEAGCLDTVPSPDGDREWTTDEYMEAIECVNDPANHVYGTLLFSKTPSGDYLNIPYLLGHGAKFFDSPNRCLETIINSPEGIEGLQFTIDLVEGGYAVPGPPGLTDDDQWAYWQRKELALIGAYPYHRTLAQIAIDQELAEPPFEVYAVNFPHKPGLPNTPFNPHAPQSFAMFKAKDRDPAREQAAKIFLRWLLDHDEYLKEWCIAQEMPICTFKSMGVLFPDNPDHAWALEAIERNGFADVGYGCGKYPELRSLWTEAMQAAWAGGADAESILNDFVEQANEALQSP